MATYVNKQYKPEELEVAIKVLTNNKFHNFEYDDAKAIIKALYDKGFRIIKTGNQ